MKTKLSLFLLVVGASFTQQSFCNPVVVVNVPGDTSVGADFISDPSMSNGYDGAAAFTTGAQALTLNDVTLNIVRVNGGGGVQVSLFSDASGLPGASLLTLNGPSDPLTGSDNYTGNFTLSANTTYWVEARTINGNQTGYAWTYSPTTETITGVGTAGDVAVMSYPSSSWGIGYNWPARAFEVTGTPVGVPEPNAVQFIILLGLAMSRLGLVRRRN